MANEQPNKLGWAEQTNNNENNDDNNDNDNDNDNNNNDNNDNDNNDNAVLQSNPVEQKYFVEINIQQNDQKNTQYI